MTTAFLTERLLERIGLRRRLTDSEFSQFYESCGGGLRSYVTRVSGDPVLGDDIFHEACYRLWRTSLPEMDADQLKSYAYKVATRLIYDSWRRRRDEVFGNWENRPSPDEPDREVRHDVQRLFSELKSRQRALLWLAYVEGCDHNEIAQRLGLSSASVRVLLFRARRKFAQILFREGLSLEDFS